MKSFWKSSSQMFKGLVLGLALAISGSAGAQLIFGNTFPFWNVTGLLTAGTLNVSGASNFANILASGGLNVTGTSTLTGGIVGATSSVAGTALMVGELTKTIVASGSATAGANTTVAKNVTSISLTAGDWDVSGICDYTLTGVTATVYSCGLGTSTDTQIGSAASGGVDADSLSIQSATFGTTVTGTYNQSVGPTRVALDTTTTIFLVAKHTYSAGSFTQFGTLRARRAR